MCDMRKAAHYASFYRAAKRITDPEARLAFYDALDAYRFDGIEPDWDNLPATAAIALEACLPNVEADLDRKKGGAPAGNRNAKKEHDQSEEEEPVKTKRFVKPTIEEIKEYCEERKNGINAENFFNFYESKGWKIGSSPMKNWKSAIITWEQRSNTPKAAGCGLPSDRLTL